MDVQQLIGEVAKRHNILVDPKDPIFVTVTLNEILLAKHVHKLQAALEQANRAAAAASHQQVEAARRVASLFVVEGAKYTTDQVRAAGSALRAQLEHLVRDSIQSAHTARAEAARHREVSQWSAAVAVACASLAVAAVASLWFRSL